MTTGTIGLALRIVQIVELGTTGAHGRTGAGGTAFGTNHTAVTSSCLWVKPGRAARCANVFEFVLRIGTGQTVCGAGGTSEAVGVTGQTLRRGKVIKSCARSASGRGS